MAVGCHLAVADLADQFGPDIGDTPGLDTRKCRAESDSVVCSGARMLLEPRQFLLGEAGAHPTDEPQPALSLKR